MSFTYLQKIPTPLEILGMIPMPEKLKVIKAKRDADIVGVLKGKDNRFIFFGYILYQRQMSYFIRSNLEGASFIFFHNISTLFVTNRRKKF